MAKEWGIFKSYCLHHRMIHHWTGGGFPKSEVKSSMNLEGKSLKYRQRYTVSFTSLIVISPAFNSKSSISKEVKTWKSYSSAKRIKSRSSVTSSRESSKAVARHSISNREQPRCFCLQVSSRNFIVSKIVSCWCFFNLTDPFLRSFECFSSPTQSNLVRNRGSLKYSRQVPFKIQKE